MWHLDKKKNCWTNGTITLPAGSQPPVTNNTNSSPEKIKDMGSMWSSSSSNSNSTASAGSDKNKTDNKKQVSTKNSSGVGKARLW